MYTHTCVHTCALEEYVCILCICVSLVFTFAQVVIAYIRFVDNRVPFTLYVYPNHGHIEILRL